MRGEREDTVQWKYPLKCVSGHKGHIVKYVNE